jgi:hypothetical protein
MGASFRKAEDPALARNAGIRQSVLVVMMISYIALTLLVISLSCWQAAVETGAPGQPIACPYRPARYVEGNTTFWCAWKPANSAARIIVGLATAAIFVVVLLKVGWYRTDRKIFLMLFCVYAWLASTGWLVLGAWDGNEIRLSRDWCIETSARVCEYAPYIGTVVVEIRYGKGLV